MFSSNVFDYIDVLQSGADAAATRQELISNNIANVNTPNYKRKDLRFETVLNSAFANSDEDSVDARVKQINAADIQTEVYTDYEELSYRSDGNNVDIDTENSILAKNEIKYNGILDCINQDFSNLKMVMQ